MKLSQLFTAPNQLTLLRMIFVPFIIIHLVSGHYAWALTLFVLAGFSDGLDGLLARTLKQQTVLGQYLDPIADKLLLGTAFVVLSFRDALPWWLTILVLSRDVAIIMTALLISLVVGYRPFRPTVLGKVSTVCQVATVFAAVSYQVHFPFIGELLVEGFTYVVAATTVASGVHYLLVVQRRYGHREAEDSSVEASSSDTNPD